MSRDDAKRLTALLIVQPRGGGDPVGSRDVDLPPDVEMDTLESFVGQRFGEPLDVASVEHPTLGVVRVGWVLEVPNDMEVPGRQEDFELVLIPMVTDPDDPGFLVSVFLRLAESKEEFERLAADGTVDRLVVRDMVPREYRPRKRGASSDAGDPGIGDVLAGIAHDLGGTLRAYPRPGRAVRRVVLRDIRDEDGTRYLDAVIESDGVLRITGHDQGPGVSQVFGPNITSYEWVYVVAPDRLPALTDELGGTAGGDVLTLLQTHHDREPSGLDAILRSPSIDAQFDNWHGSADPADEASCEPVGAGSTRAEEVPMQVEPGAASTGRAEPSVTTGGEGGEPVTDDELPPELMTLLQLDPYGRGDVSPELAARVCGWDRDLVLRLIHDSEEQVIEWGDSVTEAREKNGPDEARVCEGERRAWQKTVDLLREALRVIVTRDK